MNDESRLWIDQAMVDLEMANEAFDRHHVKYAFAIYFHAQQSAEKLLKSILIYSDKEVPRTHNLEKLLELTGPLPDLSLTRTDLVFLSSGAVETRYPDDQPDLRAAERALQLAITIKDAVLTYFHQQGERHDV
jgi:HEPN domain-containing protein